jgi:hypothetical protein
MMEAANIRTRREQCCRTAAEQKDWVAAQRFEFFRKITSETGLTKGDDDDRQTAILQLRGGMPFRQFVMPLTPTAIC